MEGLGFIGEAGLYALEHHKERLKGDHAKMAYMGKELVKVGGGGKIEVLSSAVETNMIYLKFKEETGVTLDEVEKELKEKYNILVDNYGGRIRLVTHQDVSEEHC